MSITIYGSDRDPSRTIDFATIEQGWLATVLEVFAGVDRVGLIAPTSVTGIAVWKALLLAGKTPMMLQYPTPKLSRIYWRREIAHAVEALGVQAIAFWGEHADPDLPIPRLDLKSGPSDATAQAARRFEDGLMTQLSSGTTGFRKGVGLSIANVAAHVNAYNQVLELGPDDCVVSWLPLYHDMGFISSFLMPMMLNVPLVLVDPVTWVRRPEILFEMIERHRGTLCYMPNFGFEVMARQARGRSHDLTSMRQWVSCSEPTRMASMARFADSAAVDPARMANCYAMAENVFAVTHSAGLSERRFGDTEAVSCGAAIPGVELKIVDGEVHVRSPYSLTRYEGGQSIADPDGFYPTGDVGELVDGQLYILGRTRDVMIHAGRKIILSDVDYEVGRLVPESAGRIATVSVTNEQLGTDEPVCLIESERYWARNREVEAVAAIRDAAGLAQGRVEFVAPGFITKTSSGKINRRLTAEHWAAMHEWRKGGRRSRARGIDNLLGDAGDMFPGLDPDRPLDQQLDSLGLVNMSLLLAEYGIEDGLSRSLDELRASDEPNEEQPTGAVLKIVSLFDGERFLPLMQPVLSEVGRRLNVSIHYEHVCCPVAPILLSDLIFEEQFRPRDGREGVYDGLHSALDAVRNADLIIVDDLVQMGWPSYGAHQYPRMSHRFEASPLAADLCVRWARYSERNHLIAMEVVESADITTAVATAAIDELEEYLGVPILRVALCEQLAAHTQGWPVRYLRDLDAMVLATTDPQIDHQTLAEHLFAGLLAACAQLTPRQDVEGHRWQMSDQRHWCSWLANPELVDFVLDRYDSFLVLGKPGSIPYLSRQAAELGKTLSFRSDLVCPPDQPYDCVLQTGSWGRPETDKPIFPLMTAGWGDAPANVPNSVAVEAPGVYPERAGRSESLGSA